MKKIKTILIKVCRNTNLEINICYDTGDIMTTVYSWFELEKFIENYNKEMKNNNYDDVSYIMHYDSK